MRSHSMDEVIQLANSAGILVDGKIEAQGTISELLEEVLLFGFVFCFARLLMLLLCQYARGYLIRIMRGEEEGVPIVDRIR
jgi:ABC-type molybdate transport system ATPase subunit